MSLLERAQIAMHQSGDGHRWAYNTDGGLRRWRAALGALDAGAANIVNLCFVGDSITEGAKSGGGAGQGAAGATWVTNGYVGRIRSALAAKYQDLGRGFIPVYYPNGAALWTLTGTGWVQNTTYGTTGLCEYTNNNGDYASLSFTGTGVGVLVVQGPNSGSFTITIDAGAPASFNANNATTDAAHEFQVTGLASGAHTLKVTNTATNGSGLGLYLLGAYELNANTKGVRCHMVGRWGTRMTHSAPATALAAEIDHWSPTLTVVSLGANDYTNQTTLASFQSDCQTIVSEALKYGDCLITSIGLRTEAATIPQSAYVQVLHDVAFANGCAFVDVFNRWSGNATYALNTLGLIATGDTVHPNDYGHQDIATGLLNRLLETR